MCQFAFITQPDKMIHAASVPWGSLYRSITGLVGKMRAGWASLGWMDA